MRFLETIVIFKWEFKRELKGKLDCSSGYYFISVKMLQGIAA